ncbi:MAG TPA: stage II sporulation protein P [Feifaniaceae bacterium]|nr:stage II sporulation protein P [Feifaniaceae bacterium]
MSRNRIRLSRLAALAAAFIMPGVLLCPFTLAEAAAAAKEQEVFTADPGLPASVCKELLSVEAEKITLTGSGPKVLIYHTHTGEAYSDTKDTDWRTDDTKRNVVAVGNALAEALTEYGIETIHDKTDHEKPKLATAYTRSLVTMERYKEKYPSIELFIDVHRDAGTEGETVVIGGKDAAQLLFIVGTGEKADEKPEYKENFALAKAVFEQLNAVHPGLVRPIRVKEGRYNQHAGRSLFVNVGNNRNTLEEALNAAESLAEAIEKVVQKD